MPQLASDEVKSFDQWWPSLVGAAQAIISGGTGSGKTTTVRALMAEFVQQGAHFIIVDPHHKRGDWGEGIRPLAAGRRFEEARRAFAWATRELDTRYKLRADAGRDDFPFVVLVVDEYDLFTDKRPDVSDDLRELASRFLSMIGDESRKVNLRLIIIAHGTEVENLGLSGRGSKRKNFALLELRQGPNDRPEATGTLRIGRQVWDVETRPILAKASIVLTPDMLVDVPEADEDLSASNDPVLLRRYIETLERKLGDRKGGASTVELEQARRRIADLEHQLQLAGELINAEPERIEVPVLQPDELQVLQQLAGLLPSAAGLITATLERIGTPTTLQAAQETPAAPRKQKPAPRSPSRPGTPRRNHPRPTATTTGDDEIDQALAIPAIAARVAQAQRQIKDRSAVTYVPLVLRVLWKRSLLPKEIADSQGLVGSATITRIRAACRAVLSVGLVSQGEDDRYRVNHEEVKRLRGLAEM